MPLSQTAWVCDGVYEDTCTEGDGDGDGDGDGKSLVSLLGHAYNNI